MMISLTFIIVPILIAIAGLSKAIQDKLMFHYYQSVFSKWNETFWNPSISWRNKYKNYDPKQGQRFPLSTTLFVVFTDAWHLFDSIRNNSLMLSICLILCEGLEWWWYLIVFVLFKLVFGFMFNLFYDRLLTKNEQK